MPEVKKLNVELLVEPKTFTNKESGEVIKYNEISCIIDNCVIKLSVKKDCKQLFEYLLAKQDK